MLEEAEWEDDIGDDGGFHRELQIQGQYPTNITTALTFPRMFPQSWSLSAHTVLDC